VSWAICARSGQGGVKWGRHVHSVNIRAVGPCSTNRLRNSKVWRDPPSAGLPQSTTGAPAQHALPAVPGGLPAFSAAAAAGSTPAGDTGQRAVTVEQQRGAWSRPGASETGRAAAQACAVCRPAPRRERTVTPVATGQSRDTERCWNSRASSGIPAAYGARRPGGPLVPAPSAICQCPLRRIARPPDPSRP
jgi:hypothetical protein